MTKQIKTDILIVGCGVSGLYCALHLPKNKKIRIITKENALKSDSYLAQGGICVLKDENDYDAFFEDTLRAGHYENNRQSVDTMISSSRSVIADLLSYGVSFARNGNDLVYTKEGAHSTPRILFHKDQTGKEITTRLLDEVKKRDNITLVEHCTMVDIISMENNCYGAIVRDSQGVFSTIWADYTVFATGGIGGLFSNSTNYRHLTGDALAIALKHNIVLSHIDYIQIHPTTFYKKEAGRSFLISESVRGEGAILLNDKGERFVDELLPRDVVTNAIYAEMNKSGTPYVMLSLAPIPKDVIKSHFPNIYQHCLKAGIDITKEPIPVAPAQHYFMGGIDVNQSSKTSMDRLYAVGETACNGVHGKNRLASNSLLESLVFAKRAALDIGTHYAPAEIDCLHKINEAEYENIEAKYKSAVLAAIEKEKSNHE